MNDFILQTQRLLLREILPSDAESMFELDADPEVHRYLGNEPVQNIVQIQEIIAFVRNQYATNGIGRWAVIEKSSMQFMGWAGLKFVREPINGYIDFYDLGYRLMPRFWGHGYATEAARASLEYAFNQIKTKAVYGMADEQNAASRRVLEKCGLMHTGTFDCDGSPTCWYEIKI